MNGEAVDVTKNIVDQHVGEFMQLNPLAKNRSAEYIVSAVKKKQSKIGFDY